MRQSFSANTTIVLNKHFIAFWHNFTICKNFTYYFYFLINVCIKMLPTYTQIVGPFGNSSQQITMKDCDNDQCKKH